MPIAWHESCLINRKASLMREVERLERIMAEVDRDKHIIEFYSQQIEEAKRRGKDGFDSDKFMHKVGYDK
jgi:division protein CdvB (Snf7/Vps24/ESCRT-III family)